MAVKTVLNGEAVQGDHVILEFSTFDKDGNPVSVTGKTIEWNAIDEMTLERVLSKSTTSGITILDAPDDHKFEVELLSADTEDLVGNYPHEAKVITAGEKLTIKNSDNSNGILKFREEI